jgi:outer membrane autotransporter protein
VASGDYQNGANWSLGTVPDSSHNVRIDTVTPNPAAVTAGSGGTTIYGQTVTIGSTAGASGWLSLNFPTAAPSSSSSVYIRSSLDAVVVGDAGGLGRLDVNLGSDLGLGPSGSMPQIADVQANALVIGRGAGSSGTLNLLSTGKNHTPSSYDSAPQLRTAAGRVGLDGGTGEATVTSTWAVTGRGDSPGSADENFEGLKIGSGAGSFGTVNVLAGGKISNQFYTGSAPPGGQFTGVVVGETGGTGVLTISGTNATGPSVVNSGTGFTIGNGSGGNGTVNVLAGGKLSSLTSFSPSSGATASPPAIGVGGGTGILTVSGAGSTVLSAGKLTGTSAIGSETHGATGDLYVGRTGGVGSVTLSDGGLLFLGQGAVVSDFSSGRGEYAFVKGPASGILYLGQDAGSTGTLSFGAPAGAAAAMPGVLQAAGVVIGGGGGAIVFNHTSADLRFDTPLSGNGTLEVRAGTTIIAADNRNGFSHQRADWDASNNSLVTVTETFAAGFGGHTDMYGGTLVLANDGAIGTSSVRGRGNATLAYGLDGLTIANPISVDAGAALALMTPAGVKATQTGAISGSGDITKTGTGELTLSGANSLSGRTTVEAGTLRAGALGVFGPSSAHLVAAGATLDLDGYSQTVGSLVNAGTVNMSGTPGAVLTVAGNYVGRNGLIQFGTVLGNDSSITDLMRVSGSTSGDTLITVRNVGGSGDQTIKGIKVIDVAGASNGLFALSSSYNVIGTPVVYGGAYAYALRKGTGGDGNWYLHSTLPSDEPTPQQPQQPQQPKPQVAMYQPGSPLYETMPRVALGMMGLPTLQQRVGNRVWLGQSGGAVTESQGLWGRFDGAFNRAASGRSTTNAHTSIRHWRAETGVDLRAYEGPAGSLTGSLSVHYGQAFADITSPWGRGRNETTGYGIGAGATWQGNAGFYADAQGRLTWLDTDLISTTLGRKMGKEVKGLGHALSLEIGQSFTLTQTFKLVPQAQLAWSAVSYDRFVDPFGASVSTRDGNSLLGRLGLALQHEQMWTDAAGNLQRLALYGVANLYHEFRDGTSVDVSGAYLKNREGRTWAGIGVGGSYNLKGDALSLYGEATAATALTDRGESRRVGGKLGLRVKW